MGLSTKTRDQLESKYNGKVYLGIVSTHHSITSFSQSSVRSLNDMKQMIANLPQFQEMKTKVKRENIEDNGSDLLTSSPLLLYTSSLHI